MAANPQTKSYNLGCESAHVKVHDVNVLFPCFVIFGLSTACKNRVTVEDSAQVKNYFLNCICCTRDMTNIPLSVASWSFDFSSWCEPHSIFHIFYDAARSTGMESTIECVVTKSHGLAVCVAAV